LFFFFPLFFVWGRFFFWGLFFFFLFGVFLWRFFLFVVFVVVFWVLVWVFSLGWWVFVFEGFFLPCLSFDELFVSPVSPGMVFA